MNHYKEKLASFHERHKRMPSYSEMLSLFGFKSKNAVYRLVQKLLDGGLVAKDKLGRLIPTESFSDIPFVGLVKAGFPAEATELHDSINIEQFLVRKKGDTYFFEVDGDSMIEEHITNGDLVLVERTNRARDGQIVIARIDGEYTMKYFKQKGDKIWLEPANKKFPKLYPREELLVVGLVKAVIRKYE